ncbi:alpha/beta hydrolase [Amycolatopsis panacis]|uniref:Alpha/beta hydrolase n=1 Tax=Amycolatopsis panacis TaxID=2340917 RepID=A0A419HZJ2_9PSEU|nr:alpha/beta hydrolase [Amycolatopsis panacis]RJQ82678.1 alpha/beta hydrolase [Amycolatopsis panacis]
MVSVSDVKRWNIGQLDEIFRTVQQRLQVLTHSGDDYGKVFPVEGWAGPAADNAGSTHQGLMFRIDKMAAGASIVGKSIGQAADAISGVQHAIANAEELARKYGYQIAGNGTVNDLYPDGKAPAELHPEDRARARTEVGDAITQALRTADDIDNDLASVLKRAEAGDFGTGDETTVTAAAADGALDPGLTLSEPPKDGTPSQNAGWWNSLSPAGQAILLRDHPDWLGNLDGLPGAVRSQANIARMPAERADLQRQLATAQSYIDQIKGMPYPPPGLMSNAIGEWQKIEAKLNSLDSIDATMAKGDRQLLTLDTSGERVKATIAVGNVDTAEHVAVFTPGFTSTVDGSLKGYDNDMQNLLQHSENISNRFGDGGSVAAVTWIGYEAPQTSDVLNPDLSVGNDNLAKIGAHKLDGFLNGIGASHDIQNQSLHLTALGHSYGSLTTGIALQQSTPVHDAVVFGSPGLDMQTPSDLKVPQGHVYSEWSDQDPVPRLDIAHNFGTSPYQAISGGSVAGIEQLSTGDASGADGRTLHATHEHGQYLDNNSTSQYNMANVVAGRPDLTVRHVQPWEVPSPPPTPGQPVPAPPGRDPQPPPR